MIKEKLPVLNNLNSILSSGGLRQELTGEIEKCIKYFQQTHSINNLDDISIQTGRIKVSKLKGSIYVFEESVFYKKDLITPYREVIKIKDNKVSKKRFSLVSGDRILFTQYLMEKEEVGEIIDKIHNITFPYAEYIKEEKKDA